MKRALLLLAVLAIVAGFLPPAAEAACNPPYVCTCDDDRMTSCLVWCAETGAGIYGTFGACRNACRTIYCF